jgi:uncharacterized protein (DUF2141 family)
MNKQGALLIVVLACCTAVFAGNAAWTHEVEGHCLVDREGILFVYVVDERGFASPLTGFRELSLPVGPIELTAGKVKFSLTLPSGKFGIRCFLDLNGNGRLDRGLLGPSEPWGMSWNGLKRFGFPHFEDIVFVVDRDIRGLQIELR